VQGHGFNPHYCKKKKKKGNWDRYAHYDYHFTKKWQTLLAGVARENTQLINTYPWKDTLEAGTCGGLWGKEESAWGV
jgi:hypothetical protein